jgi:sugar/nucleoside kinase (ribokinase family)
MHNAYFVVTSGQRGCSILGPSGEFVKIPAFVAKVVDRVGSGDALFSIAAMAARLGLPEEIIGFLGNAAGSQAVETIGNKKSISSMTIKKCVTALMK